MLHTLQTVLLMGGDPKAQPGWMSYAPLILIVVVFYFFMIRPQVKKQKEAKKFMAELTKGQKIVTIGGIHGKIHTVEENHFIIEAEGGDQVKLKISKSAVSMDGSVALNKPA